MIIEKPTEAPETVVVIGATGRTGRHVVAGLSSAGVRVRALVRSTVNTGLPDEVELVRGDLDDPGSVARAARGADAAFLLWHRFSPVGGAEVVAALAGHVRHIVYLSAADLRGDRSGGPVEGVWADIERVIERAPVSHTFVRGGGFASNTLAWAEQIRSGDTVRIPLPRAARSLVDERDLAAVSVRGLLDPALGGAAFAVTGPQTLTQEEQVRAIGSVLGRDLVVEEQSVEDARREYTASMGAEYANAALSHWASLVDRPEPPSDDVERLLGRPAYTYTQWVAQHADEFRMLPAAEVTQR